MLPWKYKLAVLLCLFGGLIHPQIINHAYHTGIENSYRMVGINDKSYYLYQESFGNKIQLSGNDQNGARLFEVTVNYVSYVNNVNLVKTADNHLLASSGTLSKNCDSGGLYYTMVKLDTLGNIVWKISLTRKIQFLLPWPDGSIYFVSNTVLVHYSGTGQYISEFPLPWGFNSGMIRLNNGHILLAQKDNAGERLKEIDTAGVVIVDVASPPVSHMTQTASGDLYALSGVNFIKLNAQYSVANTTSTTVTPSVGILDYKIRNDSVFACGYGISSTPHYLILDSQLNPIHQSTTNLENGYCTGVYLSPNGRVNLISTWATAPNLNSYLGYFQVGLTGNLDAIPDIGVTNVQIHHVSSSFGYYYRLAKFEGTATVKNFGSDTVYSFRLNHNGGWMGICPYHWGLNKLYNITIPPGGTISVPTGTFESRFKGAQPSDTLNIALSTSVPNGQNDANAENDVAYTTIVLTGIEEISPTTQLKVFPNPVHNAVTVSCDGRITEIEITDCLGKMVRNTSPQASETTLNLDDLPGGVYVLRIWTESGVYSQKLITHGK
jgi:hypothetical protein